jgi:hypothetical protein
MFYAIFCLPLVLLQQHRQVDCILDNEQFVWKMASENKIRKIFFLVQKNLYLLHFVIYFCQPMKLLLSRNEYKNNTVVFSASFFSFPIYLYSSIPYLPQKKRDRHRAQHF